MNSCDGCTLCCNLEPVTTPELTKPANRWCEHCEVGKGCRIYDGRPQACRDFQCLWLASDAPPSMRPDRIHLYAFKTGDVTKVCVDPDYPDAWREGLGGELVKCLTSLAHEHVIVITGRQLNFVPGDKEIPSKLMIEWVL